MIQKQIDSRAAHGLCTEHQPAGELLVFRPVYVFFYQEKIYKQIIILNSSYFNAIQTAVFYQKNTPTKCFGLFSHVSGP